jgi:hypothetical protein
MNSQAPGSARTFKLESYAGKAVDLYIALEKKLFWLPSAYKKDSGLIGSRYRQTAQTTFLPRIFVDSTRPAHLS